MELVPTNSNNLARTVHVEFEYDDSSVSEQHYLDETVHRHVATNDTAKKPEVDQVVAVADPALGRVRLPQTSTEAASASTLRRVRSPETPTEAASSRCMCERSTTMMVLLVTFNLLVLSFYFGMHCTSMLDIMVDDEGGMVRRWIGVTPTIEVFAGILLVVGIANSLHVLTRVS